MSTTTTSQINTNPITHQPPPNNPIQFISLISRNDKPLYIQAFNIGEEEEEEKKEKTRRKYNSNESYKC